MRRRDRQICSPADRRSTPRLTGACYNTVAPAYAFSLSGVYQPKGDQFAEVEVDDAVRSMRRARYGRRKRRAR